MTFKVIFYYEPYNRRVYISAPGETRAEALKWVDNMLEHGNDNGRIVPLGWDNWIMPGMGCEDDNYDW